MIVRLFIALPQQQQRQHQHGADPHGGGIPAQLAGDCPSQQLVATQGEPGGQAHHPVQRILSDQTGSQQIGLDPQLVVEPVKAPGVEPEGAEQTARGAVGNGCGQTALTKEQKRSQRDPCNGDDAGGYLQCMTTLFDMIPPGLPAAHLPAVG